MNSRLNRNRHFDSNRNPIIIEESKSESETEEMANQQELALLVQSIQQQQAEIQELREQLNQQRAQQQQQQQQQNANHNPRNEHIFQLTSDQILRHFRHLKPFNGKDDYSLIEFIKSVESALQLCGNENFRDYALQIVLNEKILGEAKRCVQRLGNTLTWETAKAELKLHFRPRKDYAELINECRNIKVGNLRELFTIVKSVNYQLNELYNFEEQENRPTIYSPENNDKYLVGIVMEKIDSLVRGNIDKNFTLIEIYNKFSELKLLDDERAINSAHRKIKNISRNFSREINRNMYKQKTETNDNNEVRFQKQYNNNSYNRNSNTSNNNYVRDNRNKYNNQNYNNFHRNNSNTYHNSVRRNTNNSGRFNTSNSNRSRYNNNNANVINNTNNDNVEPMEVDNVQQQNFSQQPQNPSYP